MKNSSFPVPLNESGRIKALYQYDVLDTFTEKEYDFITRMASQICNTPAALITLLDKKRQWVKSCFGFDIKETPREISFCNYTILDPENVNVVADLRLDDRYKLNPLVTGAPNAVFYAGAPLVTPEGFVLGSICVLDAQPKLLTIEQQEALKALAQQTIVTMELRKKNKALRITQIELKSTNKNLSEFIKLVSHDMKTPISNITMLSRCFRREYKHILDEQSEGFIDLIERSSSELVIFIDEMLKKSDKKQAGYQGKPVNTLNVLNKVVQFLALPMDIEINIIGSFPKLPIDEISLQLIFQNLITNAIKYNDKPKGLITVVAEQDKNNHYFRVSDNGSGIETCNLKKIFRKEQTLNKLDRYGNQGTGIGLAKVKSLVESVGGNISVASKINIGTDFTIAIPHYRNIPSVTSKSNVA